MPEHYFRSIVRAEYERDPWYNCQEAAALLGVITDDAVQRYINHGWLPAVKKPGGPDCGETIVVKADPSLRGPQVRQLFTEIYTNGICSHGLICSLAYNSQAKNTREVATR